LWFHCCVMCVTTKDIFNICLLVLAILCSVQSAMTGVTTYSRESLLDIGLQSTTCPAHRAKLVSHTHLPQCLPCYTTPTSRGTKAGQRVPRPIKAVISRKPDRGKVSSGVYKQTGSNTCQLSGVPQLLNVQLGYRPSPTHHTGQGPSKENNIPIKCVSDSLIPKLPLKVCTLNVRSVIKKALSVADMVCSENIDVLAITETWLGTDIDSVVKKKLIPTGYELQHVPRNSRGGGVAVLHKRGIAVKLLDSSASRAYTHFEHMECMLTSGRSARLIVIYRPPPSPENGFTVNVFMTEWEKYLDTLSTCTDDLYITGDINFHFDRPTHPDTCKVQNLFHAFGLKQHVIGATQKHGHTLDVVVTRDTFTLSPPTIWDSGVGDEKGQSTTDHYAVGFQMNLAKPVPQREEITYRKLKDIDVQAFQDDIQCDPVLADPDGNLDQLVDAYNAGLTSILDKHAPLCTKTVTYRPHFPWFTQELHDAKKERRRRERLYRRTKLEVHHLAYREQCRRVNSLLSSARQKYYLDKIDECKGNSKQLFKLTGTLMGRKQTARLPDHDSDETLAIEFNDFFVTKIKRIREAIGSSSATPLDSQHAAHDRGYSGSELSTLQPATLEEITKLIASVSNKTCQLDPVPTWLLKQCTQQLAPVIRNIVNMSLATAHVPVSLKRAVVRPSLKKPDADPNDMKNFRPVSNLPTVEKLLEQVVSSRLEVHLHGEDLHDTYQSAYRKFHSTETALLKLHSDITDALDHGLHVVVITLDLSAAFDTVDHGILLQRLQNTFGITGEALGWMASYFQDRAQSVVIGDTTSSEVKLDSGVPQGSVLGPKCYNMYTKPVGEVMRAHGMSYVIYADDTDTYLVIKPSVPWSNTATKLEACLSEVHSWMTQNLLKLNMDKTEMIIFKPKRHAACPERSLQVGDCTVVEGVCIKSLGVHLDKHLSMEHQVNTTVRTCYYNIRNIGSIRRYISDDACKTLIQSLVISRLDYANALYIGLPKYMLDRLQRAQNSAARVITHTPRREHITPVLYTLHWLPVEKRVKYKVLLLVFKALHGLAPRYITDMLQWYTPTRSLRSASKRLLVVPDTETVTYGKKSFRTAAPGLWNGLPSSLRSATELQTFKSSLKTVLFKEYYY